MKGYFSTLKQQANNRAKESTLSVLGISNPSLRNHLSERFETVEPFVHGPVFEQTFAWEESKVQMNDLVSEGLLSKELVTALDDDINGRYAFKAEWFPFKHQLAAWRDLLNPEPKSRIITSGTGSGKTECFMVPVLEDLVREVKTEGQALKGVRALFLYPLNALINSQKERLNAWTQHFEGDIRFCLFNGNTPNDPSAIQSQIQIKQPQEVLSRNLMRDNPAPILVTNGTMLEYMLVRQADAPIIEQSKGKLRWIVLDEAHTYVGSQAAELALQLRRVMQAFEVEPENVRFVATSATIAGSEAESQLRRYLAELAGVSEAQVDVIGGKRAVPKLPDYSLNNRDISLLESIDPEGELPENKKDIQDPYVSASRYRALCESEIAKRIRSAFTANGSSPLLFSELASSLSPINLTENELYRWLDICTGTKESYDRNAQPFLKLRAHYFQRTLNGLWACIDPNCSEKSDSLLNGAWQFGQVLSEQRQKCDCGAPVLELSFCSECNEPHLLGVDKGGILTQWTGKVSDEFSLLEEGDKYIDEERTDQQSTPKASDSMLILSATENQENMFFETIYDHDGKEASVKSGSIRLAKYLDEGEQCSKCGFSGRGQHAKALRRGLLGAPFYTTTAVPTVLEYCPDIEKDKDTGYGPLDAPGRGRRLITFTDSRQGTAKMSVQMQQEAERSRLRGLVFKELRKHVEEELAIDDELLDIVRPYIEESTVEDIEEFILIAGKRKPQVAQALTQYLSALEKGASRYSPKAISWKELADRISMDKDLQNSILTENKRLSPEVFDVTTGSLKLANMLLTRELARRPKFKNNLETQGLIRFVYPEVEKLSKAPEQWKEKGGLTLSDWKDYLKICLDFFVRENTYVNIDREWGRWIGMHFAPKTLIAPDSKEEEESRIKKWPQINKGRKIQQRLITLLRVATGIDIEKPEGEQLINGWLQDAWKTLTKLQILRDSTSDKQYSLDLREVSFALLTEGFICPVTNKVLDTTFRGLTPYIPANGNYADYQCTRVNLPPVWEFKGSDRGYDDSLQSIRSDIEKSQEIRSLREQNVWTDINDRTVEGGFYYATAEHSAQQSAERLADYEDKFKSGKKNVLNCSTTMEMGVDIGGITAVVMNNVPPHPANFLQRAGRAGRSKESRALSYTICKNNPHDTLVFNNPKWAFTTSIPAPHVEFSSEKLVQRHVNSYLLGRYLVDVIGPTDKEKINLNLEWFYLPDIGGKSVAECFSLWVMTLENSYLDGVKKLVKGTALSGVSPDILAKQTAKKILELSEKWVGEYKYIQTELNDTAPNGPYAHKLDNEKSRLCREYLLRDLATKAFLPGYGFPTDVVSIDTDNVADYIREKKFKKNKNKFEREDNVSINRGLPSRNLSVAIREYAPGSEIVIDGRVHRSAGISLNWQNVHVEGSRDAQKFDLAWRCPHCGQTGYESNLNKQANFESLTCSNVMCGKVIPINNECRKKVIQPTGFVTDYYIEPTNNITHHTYVPVQPAWVSAKGVPVPLPVSELGYMITDHQGKVFHYSSGMSGTGFALCMACGRAESMTSTEELPKALNHERTHKPPRPSKFAKDENDRHGYCDGSGRILESIHLGVHSQTDVFELVLRHPDTGEYIPDSDEGRVIATSLVVALRKALVKTLGISVNEVEYSVRPAVVGESQHAMVLQLFDSVSGGAGFATSTSHYITQVLRQMLRELECPKACDAFCPDCLLESDSRHDTDKLNRQIALKWLGDNFTRHLNIPPKYQRLLTEAEYCPLSIKEQLISVVAGQVSEVKFVLSSNIERWDTSVNLLKSRVYEMLSNSINVSFIVPDVDYPDDIKLFLKNINNIGASLYITKNETGPMVFQALTDVGCFSLANLEDSARTPGIDWLMSDDISVISTVEPELSVIPYTIEVEPKNLSQVGAIQIEAIEELNGTLTQLGERFKQLVCDSDSRVKELLSSNTIKSVHYSDRYLQSPSAVMLVSEAIKGLVCGHNDCDVSIDTCFDEKNGRPPAFISQDWDYKADFRQIFQAWLENATGRTTKINIVEDKKTIQHRRVLTIVFESDNTVQITLDQGFGYWWLELTHGLHRFDFERDCLDQVKRMLEVQKKASVKNSADWSTLITTSLL
ncbi:DEAD/DEAH box helicase [Vibrio cholerae]|uniref:DEAD/DEAH box helicase n=1 Tax=Vibrio cholerae TaxID=666 RepID=UPI00084B9A93|nr:DEAD/DEAH box helicase [Vibrio cholerae]EJL6415309.1 DEAD/DEAH box helicase [Vibrio cholerae]EJL6452474.1 DEAD/DEAH box helicase [Vibrio cholerae]NOF77798.1 DEAD/DEAH box helicase [Vibrio cholerae]NOF79727.1 DEAD/DEAH box helicase [Vibrio cholerae]OEC32297.1 DEAD/DEAH box helicase [Vibrio cholerae]